MFTQSLPGSEGEHCLQGSQGSQARAAVFYQKQLLHHLNPFMQRFIAEQPPNPVATTTGGGAGPPRWGLRLAPATA